MRSREFRRDLDPEFFRALEHGPLRQLLVGCRAVKGDVRLRGREVHVYVRGNRIAALRLGRGRLPLLELHPKYCANTALASFPFVHESRSRRRFGVTEEFVSVWSPALKSICRTAEAARAGPEGGMEADLISANQTGTPVEIIDRQVQLPRASTRDRLDLLGVALDPTTGADALVAIELKRGTDTRIQDLPRQMARYVGMLAPKGRLRAEVVASYRTVAQQMRALDLPAPDPTRFHSGMGILALVVVDTPNPRSDLLPRAHRNATAGATQVRFAEVTNGAFRLGPVETWGCLGVRE